jgi:hypothetical protein
VILNYWFNFNIRYIFDKNEHISCASWCSTLSVFPYRKKIIDGKRRNGWVGTIVSISSILNPRKEFFSYGV